MANKKFWLGMSIMAFVFCGILTSCWSTGRAREVTPRTALTMQRVRSTIMSDEIMKIFVDDVPYELANSENKTIILNNGEHMVYAVLGDVESKSVRFTTNSVTMVINVAPKGKLIGTAFDLIIEVFPAK